jgi:hypothetical protein
MNIKGFGRKRYGLMRYYGAFEGTEENQENLRMASIPVEIKTGQKRWRHYVPTKRQ